MGSLKIEITRVLGVSEGIGDFRTRILVLGFSGV
jgi:hypothetical protein